MIHLTLGNREQCCSPGIREQCCSSGIREQCCYPGIREQCCYPGIREQCCSPGIREQCCSPGIREQCCSPECEYYIEFRCSNPMSIVRYCPFDHAINRNLAKIFIVLKTFFWENVGALKRAQRLESKRKESKEGKGRKRQRK